MHIASSKINSSGIRFSKDLISERIAYYDKIYLSNLYILYELGMVSNPSVFDQKEFLLSLKQSFPDEFKLFRHNMSKALDFSPAVFEYIMTITTNKAFKDVIEHFYAIRLALDAYEVYERVLKTVKFPKKGDIGVYKPRLYTTLSFEDKGMASLDSRFSPEIFVKDKSEKLKTFYYHDIYYNQFVKDCGISDDILSQYKLGNKGLFIKGLTFYDEVKYIDLLLTGFVTANGDYAKEFNKFHEAYYDSFYEENTGSVSCQTYKDKLFSKLALDVFDYTKSLRESLGDYYLGEYFVSDYRITFRVKETCPDVDKPLSWERYISVGSYALDITGMKELSINACMRGYHGEFIQKSEVKDKGYAVTGLPIKIDSDWYYPLHRVTYDLNSSNIANKIGVAFDISYLDIEEVLNGIGLSTSSIKITSEDFDEVLDAKSLDKLFRSLLDKMNEVGNKAICGSPFGNGLVASKILIECGYPEHAYKLREYIQNFRHDENFDYDTYACKLKFVLNKYNNYYEYIKPSSELFTGSEFERVCKSIGVALN